jgi:hypothetical protein
VVICRTVAQPDRWGHDHRTDPCTVLFLMFQGAHGVDASFSDSNMSGPEWKISRLSDAYEVIYFLHVCTCVTEGMHACIHACACMRRCIDVQFLLFFYLLWGRGD